jgi:beta-galactosidase
MYLPPNAVDMLADGLDSLAEKMDICGEMIIDTPLASSLLEVSASLVQSRPILLCEYAHAMENSLGNFREYWEVFERHDNIAGGFIWDFVDQSIRRKTPSGDRWLYGGDFNEGESSYYFCANGLVSADRKPHPSLFEARRVMQNISVRALDLGSGRITIHNKHYFTDLNDFRLLWRIEAEGVFVAGGYDDALSLPPQGTMEYVLPIADLVLPEAECFLTVSFALKHETSWADQGFITAVNQLPLRDAPERPVPAPGQGGPLTVEKSEDETRVFNENISLSLGNTTGFVTGLSLAGRPVLNGQLRPNYYRALTDNDRGIANLDPPNFLPIVEGLAWKTVPDELELAGMEVQSQEASVLIHCRYRHPLFEGEVVLDYEIYPGGRLLVRHTACPKELQPYRIGLTAPLSGEFRHFKWYGRGPHENYCDRKTGADVSVYSADVDELGHDYMRPQENGNRCDLRWLAIEDDYGWGLSLRDTTGRHMGFSAHPYSQDELDAAEHIHELEKRNDAVFLQLDALCCGVGGDAPGFTLLKTPYAIRAGQSYVQEFELY